MVSDVSVVMATYNGARFVRQALDSVRAQTAPPREVVVVDDASADATPDVVAAYAREAPFPVRLLRLRRNSGSPTRPLNLGVEAARGTFVAVLDQDDWFAADKLQAQRALAESEPRPAFVFSGCGHSRPPGRTSPPADVAARLTAAAPRRAGAFLVPGRDVLRLLVREGNFVVGFPGFLFRRALWLERGGLDESLALAADYDFLCWLCTRGPAAFLPRPLYVRREHDENLCRLRPLAVRAEVGRVQARAVFREPWLRADADLARELGDRFFALAYWLREAGDYAGALRFLLWTGRLGGWERRTAAAVAKLLPHWLARQVVRRAGPGRDRTGAL